MQHEGLLKDFMTCVPIFRSPHSFVNLSISHEILSHVCVNLNLNMNPTSWIYLGIAIRGLFEHGTNAIIDVRIASLDSPSYRFQDPEKVLQQQENAKRQKYKDICETRQESFHPFIASTDGMLAPEATKILQHLAHINVTKTQKPYSATVKHLRLRIAITLVKAAHHCLWGVPQFK
jgi:hypothetical protein